MTDSGTGFLARREARTLSRELTQMIVLGYGIALICIILGGYKYFVVTGAWDALWRFVIGFGALSMLVTLVMPFAWYWPERALRVVGNKVGHVVMSVVLGFVYYVMIWPVGVAIRATRGARPIYRWSGPAPRDMEGWNLKQLPADLKGDHGRGRVGAWNVLRFFMRSGQYALIPGLLVLVAIGIVLFFLQTSVLAPFIYTLF